MNKKDLATIKNKLPGLGSIGDFISSNGSTLSLIGSIVLIGMSLYSAFKAADKLSDINEQYEEKVQEIDSTTPAGAQMAKEMRMSRDIRYVLAYKYAILFGAGAIALELLSYSLSGKAIATLTAALALEKDRAKKLIENGRKFIGEEKFKEVEEKTMEEMMDQFIINQDGPIAIRAQPRRGKFFFDTNRTTLFQMHEKELLAAIQNAMEYCERNHGLHESKFYEDFLGIEAPPDADKWWGPKNPFKAHIGSATVKGYGITVSTLVFDNRPMTMATAGVPITI